MGVKGQFDLPCPLTDGQKSSSDDDSAEFGEHVGERGLGLGGVPGLEFAAVGEVSEDLRARLGTTAA